MNCSRCKSGEYYFWFEVGATWASYDQPWLNELLNIINFDKLPYKEYKNNLEFQSEKDMILGFFNGLLDTLQELKSIVDKKNKQERIRDPDNISEKLKKILLDHGLMEPFEWEQIAAFIYHTSADNESSYVIYQNSRGEELGRELLDNLVRKKIQYNSAVGWNKGEKDE